MDAELSRSQAELLNPIEARRQWPRFRRRLQLNYFVDHIGWQRGWRDGFTTDAGPAGMRVVSLFVPEIGRNLRLSVEVPGAGALALWGRVAWSESSAAAAARTPTCFGVVLTAAPETWFHYWRGALDS